MSIRIVFVFLACLAARGTLLAQQSGTTYQRLRSMHHYTVDGTAVLTDSSTYQYHGDMGSIFSEEKYWYADGWGYDGYFAEVYKYSNHVLAPGGVLDVRYDTMKFYQADQSGQLRWYQQRHVAWNGTAITSFDRIGYGQDYFRYRIAQSAGSNGLPARIYELRQQASSVDWDTVSLLCLSYDAQGRLVKDSSYNAAPGPGQLVYELATRHEYLYQPDGRLRRMNFWGWTGTDWKEYNGLSYFYDAGGRLTQALSGWLRGTANVVDSQSRYRYEYSGGACSLKAYETNFGGGNWVRSEQQQFYRNSQQRVDSVVDKYIISIGSYGERRFHIYRDAGGLPLSSSLYRWSNNIPEAAYDSVLYRYESYQSTGVPALPKSSSVQLYPNPVRDGKLYLRWGQMPLSTSLEVQVTDRSGRLLRQVAGAVSYPSQSVELGDLPAGAYVVRVRVGGEDVAVEKVGVE